MHHFSNMSSNPEEFLLIKNDKQEEISRVEIEETSKTPSSLSPSEEEEEKLEEKDEDLDEDGFRTPTTLDHKITVLTCPPAPKKMKQSLKRRAEYNDQYCNCRQLPLDLSKEVELLFQTKHIPFSGSHGAKKIRRDNNQETTK
ncbi:cyclin-dependent protein kinase inhibitor SMR3-like [Vicia villosa]|uniref:cyclin-dependent protein kinase inhibitor SMR3-like n=1 Tax=Vicia villosa TaxID=3911 RepID=UPI00273B83E5|nr:cyclin-dependent protein kinase inhibitor SMR3-like [Vicia villosa]